MRMTDQPGLIRQTYVKGQNPLIELAGCGNEIENDFALDACYIYSTQLDYPN